MRNLFKLEASQFNGSLCKFVEGAPRRGASLTHPETPPPEGAHPYSLTCGSAVEVLRAIASEMVWRAPVN
jgi:hypothetical protein